MVAYMDNMSCMVRDPMRIERGKHVVCGSGFPLEGVHRFKKL
jgi:hypothetical protein